MDTESTDSLVCKRATLGPFICFHLDLGLSCVRGFRHIRGTLSSLYCLPLRFCSTDNFASPVFISLIFAVIPRMLVSGPCIGPRAAACWHVSPIPYSFHCNVGRRSTPLRTLQIDTLKQQQQHRAASAGRLKATSEQVLKHELGLSLWMHMLSPIHPSLALSQVQLLNPVATERLGQLPLLVYCPGSDGTGNSIAPQLPGLTAAGFDVRCRPRYSSCKRMHAGGRLLRICLAGNGLLHSLFCMCCSAP